MVLKLSGHVRNTISLLYMQKTGWNSDIWNFLAKKWIFLSILVYVHWKSAFWVRPCLKASLWRHTLTDFHDFGINGKKRPYPIPWYQTIILWARQFQVHKGGGNHLGKPCYKKGLVGRGLKFDGWLKVTYIFLYFLFLFVCLFCPLYAGWGFLGYLPKCLDIVFSYINV